MTRHDLTIIFLCFALTLSLLWGGVFRYGDIHEDKRACIRAGGAWDGDESGPLCLFLKSTYPP